jgi:hypothetical protein
MLTVIIRSFLVLSLEVDLLVVVGVTNTKN